MKAGEVPIIEVAKLFPVELPGCVSDVCVCVDACMQDVIRVWWAFLRWIDYCTPTRFKK